MASRYQEQDEGYYASMTDLMVGVIFIFIIIVMILSFQIKKQQDDAPKISEEMRVFLEQFENEPSDFPNIKILIEELGEKEQQIKSAKDEIAKGQITIQIYEKFLKTYQLFIDNNEKAIKYILNNLKNYLEQFGYQNIELDYETGTISLPVSLNDNNFNSVLFRSGSYLLSDKGKVAVHAISDYLVDSLPCFSFKQGQKVDLDMWLMQILNKKENSINAPQQNIFVDKKCPEESYVSKIKTIFVEGHTDGDQILIKQKDIGKAKVEDNWELSSYRAIEAFKALLNRNPQLDDLRNLDGEFIFGVSGYADTRKVEKIENNDEEKKKKNRRIEVSFLFHTLSLEQFKKLLEDSKVVN